ncbi:MAG: hypothetical protein ACTS73_07040 [Arsenophonus sp. NEOnobi-MAG3]
MQLSVTVITTVNHINYYWVGMVEVKVLKIRGSQRQGNMLKKLVATALFEACKKQRRVATMAVSARGISSADFHEAMGGCFSVKKYILSLPSSAN